MRSFQHQVTLLGRQQVFHRYPRNLIAETITGNDGYPLYRPRSVADKGRSVAFEAHINVEYYISVKLIKYICKYVNKASDMTIIGVTNANDEVSQYQMGR